MENLGRAKSKRSQVRLEGEVGGRVGTGPAGTRCLEEAMKAVRLVD